MNLKTLLSKLDLDERQRLCELAGTKHTHLWQLLGGHRAASLRLLSAMVHASKLMFPKDGKRSRKLRRWLTLEEVHAELVEAQRRRARKSATP